MQVLEEIIIWSERLPNWQSDALRRLWTQEAYSDADFGATLSMLKAEFGLGSGDHPVPQAQRFTREHIGAHSTSGSQTILLGMHDVKNVNALAAGQRLEFGSEGVTVIFGENASGKSGYSRVLKQACRARGTKEPVHPNVFAASTPAGAPQATFDIKGGDELTPVTWSPQTVPPEELSDIAVFDSKCARVYVDEANDVAYIPYGLDILGELAKVCERIRHHLRGEIQSLPEPPKILEDLVGEGKPLARLTAQTSAEEISRAAVFTGDDATRLSDLTKQLAVLLATDPKKLAEEWKRRKQRIDSLRQEFLTAKSVVSEKSIRRFMTLQRNAVAAEKAARLASERALAHEPLPGTGGEEWRIMFEAARKFSEQSAYPGLSFPVTTEGSRCVLCQQLLDSEAGDRLRRFWEFLQADTAQTAAVRRKGLSDAVEEFRQRDFDIESRHQGVIEEIGEFEPGADVSTRSYINSLTLRAKALSNALASGNWDVPQLSSDPWRILSYASKRCQSEVERYEKAAKEDPKPALEKEKAAMESRKLLAENREAFIQHLKNLQRRAALEQCFSAADTTRITRKHSELMRQALTQELKDALDEERKELGIEYIPIKLNRTGSVGTTLHQLALESPWYRRIGLSDILSEGEHRMVAIASFLAELSTSRRRSGIVFDDPVSSLDHRWREQVARRLVKEGLRRQVIIFTHDVVFLFAVKHEAARQRMPLTVQSVLRSEQTIGITVPKLPWPAMGVRDRIAQLRDSLQSLRATHKRGETEVYEVGVGRFYGLLREAWERAIEEVLFGDVLGRFRKDVQTQKLRSVEVTKQDFESVHHAMAECSDRMTGHDEPAGSLPRTPSPDNLAADLDRLESYVKEIWERQKRVEPSRKELLEPPRPADLATPVEGSH